MIDIKTKRIYSEVYQILNLLGDEYINKLPKGLYDMLKEKRDSDYNPQYCDNIPLYKQNVDKETISIIALLHLSYWCKNEDERNALKKEFKSNEDKYQQDIKKKYNPGNLFT